MSKLDKEVRKYIQMAKDTSDIRIDKVEEVRKLIKEGKYNVDNDEVAKSIINFHKDISSNNNQKRSQ